MSDAEDKKPADEPEKDNPEQQTAQPGSDNPEQSDAIENNDKTGGEKSTAKGGAAKSGGTAKPKTPKSPTLCIVKKCIQTRDGEGAKVEYLPSNKPVNLGKLTKEVIDSGLAELYVPPELD